MKNLINNLINNLCCYVMFVYRKYYNFYLIYILYINRIIYKRKILKEIF